MLKHTLLYLIIVLSICCALNSFLSFVLLNSRRLMYIIAGMPTTLALDACCARYITICAAQHILVNACSLGVGCCAMLNNHSRSNPFKCRAHPARFNHSAYSYRLLSGLMMLFFSFSNASTCRLAWVNDACMARPMSASGWMDADWVPAVAPNSRTITLICWYCGTFGTKPWSSTWLACWLGVRWLCSSNHAYRGNALERVLRCD
jgi:hypothetical protein